MNRVKIVQYGVGPIGAGIINLLLEKPWAEIVGAIDVDPNKIGKDLGSVCGLNRELGVEVSGDSARTLRETQADMVVHSTVSSLKAVLPQLEQIIDASARAVSTCEELAYPYYKYPDFARKLDDRAKSGNVAVLGTGVNPGFVMDTLPLLMSGVCQRVESIRVERVVDAGRRRLPLQRKIGAGVSQAEFKRKVDEGTIRHVGLTESAAMIAAAVGWQLDAIDERIEPVIAERTVKTEHLTVKAGQVAGVKQVAKGMKAGFEHVTLDLEMYVGAVNPRDTIKINGSPNVSANIEGGIHGDHATTAIVVNCIPRVLEAEPGLLTMKDIQLPHAILS